MYKLVFFVPASHLEIVKTAIFDAGAGRVGRYDRCCWQTLGKGQFRPLPGSNAHIGTVDKLETIDEYRVELVCTDDRIAAAVNALRRSHPYEQPAFDVWRLADIEVFG